MIGSRLPSPGTMLLHITHVVKATKLTQQGLYELTLHCSMYGMGTSSRATAKHSGLQLSHTKPYGWLCTFCCSACPALQHTWEPARTMIWGFWPQTMLVSLGIHRTSRTNCCPRSSPCCTQWDQGAGVSPFFTLSFLSTLQRIICFIATSDKLP